jgi:hypothetical protein
MPLSLARGKCAAGRLDIVLCPSLPDVAASRAEHRFESEDAIESLAQVLEAFKMGLDSD